MTEAASLSVTLSGRDVGLSTLLTAIDAKTKAAAVGVTALEVQLAKLAATQGAAGASAGPLATGLGGAGAGARTAATNIVALQQAEARLLATQGDLAGAAAALNNTLNTETLTARQTIAVKTQLAQVEGRLATAQNATSTTSVAATTNATALAQAEARLLVTQGNLAGAQATLNNALNEGNLTARQTIAVKTQLAQVENRLSGQSQSLTGLFNTQNGVIGGLGESLSTLGTKAGALGGELGAVQQFGASAASSIASMVGPAALASATIGGVISVVQSFGEAFKFKADLDATTGAINAQLKGVRDSNQVWAEGAAFASKYKITQEDLTSSIQASIGVMRASSASTTDLLTTLSRLQVLAPEKPISEAARALRELQSGDTTSIKELFNIAAADANKMKAEIVAGGDAVAVLSKFLDGAGVGMDSLAAGTTGAAGAMKDLAKAQEDLKLAQAQFAQGPGMKILATETAVVSGVTRILSGDYAAMGQAIAQAEKNWEDSITRQRAYNAALEDGKTKQEAIVAGDTAVAGAIAARTTAAAAATTDVAARTAAAAAADQAYQAVLAQGGGVLEANAAAARAHADALASFVPAAQAAATATQQLAELTGQAIGIDQAAAGTAQAVATAELNAANAMELTGVQARAAALAAQQKSDADQVASVNAQTNSIANQTLAAAAQQAAAALIGSGAAGARTAAILASSSSQIDVLTAAYYRLQAAQIAAGNAANAASVAQTVAKQRAAGTGGRGDSSDASEGAAAAKARGVAVQDALDDQIRANGTNAQKIALANRNLQEQIRLHGANSAAAIRAQTALDSAQDKGAKGGGGGGAGGTKLSDQTKLNNSLLTQQGDYQNKSEDAATQHAIAVEKIEADFAAKILAQQKLNEVSKLNSQADFYDRLTSSDLNKKKGGQAALKQLDEQYQKDFQKSQELAQSGSPKLAADFLALKQKQAEQELTFQEKLAEAKEKGDKGEVSRLTAIQALRRQAAAEEEKQLLAGGDQDVNAKNKALDDAAAKEADAQDKIGLASDRATEKKILGATLAGKAIDDELTKVNTLGTAYAGLGGRSPLASGGPAAATPPNTPTPSGGGSDIAGALDGLRSAISAVENAVRGSGDQVASAVKGIRLSAPGVS